MSVDYEGAADEAWANYCAAMREMGRESEIMGLYHRMEQEPEPDMPWGVGEDDDDFEPPPVDTSGEEMGEVGP